MLHSPLPALPSTLMHYPVTISSLTLDLPYSHPPLCAVSLCHLHHHPQPGIFTPNVPQRTYFIFRRPIRTTPALAADRVACQELYDRVRQEVEGGLGYLLRMREQDPYKDLLPRMLYEATWGGGRRAPSFDP